MYFPTYDILIIGCGPAGLSAAVNATIRGKKTIIYGGEFCSPKLHRAPHINNYLGFSDITGEELRSKYLEHVKKLDINIEHKRIDNIYPVDGAFNVVAKGDMLIAKAIVLAMGMQNPHFLPGEKELLGRGVGYCATCDGMLYRGKNVAVIGYNKTAEEEVNYLSTLAAKVYYLPLYESEDNFNHQVEIIKEKPKMVLGKEKLEALETVNRKIVLDGLFIIREQVPPAQLIPGLDLEKNAIIVNRKMATNIQGVYAAGDCTGEPYQLAKAVGEGATAGLSAAGYIDRLEK